LPRGIDFKNIPPPLGGVIKSTPSHLVPQGYLADAQNMYASDGKLVLRAGYSSFGGSGTTARNMGGLYFQFSNTGEKIVISTISGWHAYNTSTGNWDSITQASSKLNSDITDQTEFTIFNFSNGMKLIGVNNVDSTKKWDGKTSAYEYLGDAISGSAAVRGIDVCNVANRVVIGNTLTSGGSRSPFAIRISAFNNPDSWPSNLVVHLTETPGEIVGIEALSRLSFAIHKEDSQWVGTAQGGVFPFKFELITNKPGTVSPAALLRHEGKHYYMANDANFYVFDGISTKEIGEAIAPYIKSSVNWNYLKIAHGTYYSLKNQIWWFYPGAGSETCNKVVSYNIKTKEWQPQKFANSITTVFPVKVQSTDTEQWSAVGSAVISAWDRVWDIFFTSEETLIFGEQSGATYQWGKVASDAGNSISGYFTLPLFSADDPGNDLRVDSLLTYWEQTTNTVNMNVDFGVTDTLASINYNESHIVNISSNVRHLITVSNIEGQFVTARHSFNAKEAVGFLGAVFFLNEKGII